MSWPGTSLELSLDPGLIFGIPAEELGVDTEVREHSTDAPLSFGSGSVGAGRRELSVANAIHITRRLTPLCHPRSFLAHHCIPR